MSRYLSWVGPRNCCAANTNSCSGQCSCSNFSCEACCCVQVWPLSARAAPTNAIATQQKSDRPPKRHFEQLTDPTMRDGPVANLGETIKAPDTVLNCQPYKTTKQRMRVGSTDLAAGVAHQHPQHVFMRIRRGAAPTTVSVQSSHLDRPHAVRQGCSCAPT